MKRKLNKKGILVIIIGVIVLLGVIVGLCFLLNKEEPKKAKDKKKQII